ncbi:MAG: glycosyltransferase [Solibacillus sp.]
MKKMKVLHVIPNFGVGGAEKLVVDYLMNFNSELTDVMAVSLYANSNSIYDMAIKENGLKVVYLDKKPGLDISITKKLKKIIETFKPDVVHSHLYTVKYILPIASIAKFKWFHTIHNEPNKDATGLDKIANKVAFKGKCKPIALSKELATSVAKYYGIRNDVLVINNGVDIEKFSEIKVKKDQLLKELNIPNDALIIGHVGRFFEQKNHVFIIDIFNYVLKKNDKAQLLLIGDGELKEEIVKKVDELGIKENVKFLGVRKDIPNLLSMMDVFLFPSLHEGFPLTLIEAQATKVRCIISNTIDEIAILSENTLPVDLNADLEEWYIAITNRSIKNSNFGNINDYNIKHITDKLLNAYLSELES